MMKDDLVDQNVATEFGGSLQIVAQDSGVSGNEPALRVAHPSIQVTGKLPVGGVTLVKGLAGLQDGEFKRGFQNSNELFIQRLGADRFCAFENALKAA